MMEPLGSGVFWGVLGSLGSGVWGVLISNISNLLGEGGQTAKQMSGFESDIWGHAVIKALHTKPENPGCPFLITTVNLRNDSASQSYRFLVTKVGRVTPQTKPSLTIADLLKPEPLAPSVHNPMLYEAFPMALVVKNLLVNAGDARDMGSIPGSGRSPGGRNGNPLQYSCLEKAIRGAQQATVHGVTKNQTQLSD